MSFCADIALAPLPGGGDESLFGYRVRRLLVVDQLLSNQRRGVTRHRPYGRYVRHRVRHTPRRHLGEGNRSVTPLSAWGCIIQYRTYVLSW